MNLIFQGIFHRHAVTHMGLKSVPIWGSQLSGHHVVPVPLAWKLEV